MIGLIIPSVSAEIYVHQSDFPFSIQYPTGWEVFDEDEWGGVAIGDKTGRNGMYVGILCSEILGDDCGQAGADYQELDYLKQDSEYACEAVTMKEDYLTCRDLKFLEEFVHELDGYRAVTVLEEATILDSGKNPLFPDGKAGRYQDVGFVTYVLVGNDIWFIYSVNEVDKFDQIQTETILSTFMINNIYAQEDIFTPPSWWENLINAIMSLFSWNTSSDTSSVVIETPMEENFMPEQNYDWDNPIIMEDLDPCLYWEC
mgnify:CR=1 FL=1